MKFITKGKDYKFVYQIKNNSGAVVDLTSYKITYKIKEDRDSNTVKVQKDNTAAGGGNDEIKIIKAAGGLIAVFLDRSDTLNLSSGTNFEEVYATNDTNDYNIIKAIKVTQNVNITGDSAEDISVIADKVYEASISSNGSESVSTESGWDNDITSTRQSAGLFHVASTAEFPSNKTEIEVQTAEDGVKITKEHYSSSLIKIRIYDAQGSLYDSPFIISIKVYE